jgi:hypothetical protein
LLNKPGLPMYRDPTLELLASYHEKCRHLATHSYCDGCPGLIHCRESWDKMIETFEDKRIPKAKTKTYIIRIKKVVMV